MSNGNNKIWELLMKAAVPVSVVCAGALISHEVRITVIEDKIENLPPPLLLQDINEIKEYLRTIDERLRSLETKVK